MSPPARLVACSSCGCFARVAESRCPHCDAPLRQADGTIAPSKVALFLGLAALAAPLATQTACGNDVESSGAGGSSSSTDTATSTGPSSTTSTAVTTTAISAYGTGPTTSTVSTSSGPMVCDDSGICGDSTFGCFGCALAGECAGLYDDCAADSECTAVSDCIGACGDQACVDQCATDHPAGAAAYEALLVCVICDQCYNDCDGLGSGCP